MTIDLESRRSIRRISAADFAAYPVWEWAINEEDGHGHDEPFLRPTSLDSLPAGRERYFVVGASATLSDDSVLPACAEVRVAASAAQVEPMFIFVQERQLAFGGSETITVLSHYTKQADTRPVRWSLAVPVEGQGAAPQGDIRRSILSRVAGTFRRRGLLARRDSILVP